VRSIKKILGGLAIMCLTTGQSEAQRPHLAVSVGMDFRRPPAAAFSPLLRRPPPGEL
jgi:hypothetical protein